MSMQPDRLSKLSRLSNLTQQPGRATDFLPLLSRGKHRKPRNGACVMEYTSYLAGEKWSDHPSCTHRLLSELARQVNDFTADETRQTLVELVPDMIGLTSTDPRIDIQIALRAARTALPVVAEGRQQIMAVAVLTCERLRAELDGQPDAPLSGDSRDALALAPAAATWASRYSRTLYISRRSFRRQVAPATVRYAVQGIARASVPNPDALLHELLVATIADCHAMLHPDAPRRIAVPHPVTADASADTADTPDTAGRPEVTAPEQLTPA